MIKLIRLEDTKKSTKSNMVHCLGSIPTCSRQYCHRLNQQTMSENHYHNIRKRKDIPLIIAVIYNENLLTGSIFQNFEEAYKLARAFHKKNKTDFIWEFEMIEAIIKFVNLKKGLY